MRPLLLVASLGMLCLACQQLPHDLTVVSFNIRYGTADDGINAWPERRTALLTQLRALGADVIGVQEALRFQLDEIVEALPAYGEIGVGRRDGDTAGEYAAILYRTDRLRREAHGTFWFSNTPTVPGSVSWGNSVTRICTWARLGDGRSGRSFYVYNVHLDHESQESRERSVELLLQRVSTRGSRDPVLILGDFNAGEDNAAVRALRDAGFRDTFRTVHPDARWVGTFGGFRSDSTGPKIDYVFASAGWRVLSGAIVRNRLDGREPSDHFPVTATLHLR